MCAYMYECETLGKENVERENYNNKKMSLHEIFTLRQLEMDPLK